jgi:signal transduction histidine kinase
MRSLRPALIASALAGGFVLAGLVLAAIRPTASAIAVAFVGGAAAAFCSGLGLAVARREPRNVVGPLLVVVGLAMAFTAARLVGWQVLGGHPQTARRLDWLVALLGESAVWLVVALALLFLYFPDGRLPGPRWRAVPPLLIAAGFAHHAYGAVDPAPFAPPLEHLDHPFGPPPRAIDAVATLGEVVLLVTLIASAASLFVRFRHSDEHRRRQLKWLALAGLTVPGFIVVCLAEILVLGHPGPLSVAIAVAGAFGIPLAIAVAVLRDDLYDVDRALAGTVAFAVTSGLLLALFGAVAFAGGVVLGRGSAVAAAAATALCAAVLAPVRRAAQRRVDRRLYPLRQAALAAITGLERDIHAGGARPEQLGERLRSALRDPALEVGYVLPGTGALVRGSGGPLDDAGSVPVLMSGAPIGALRSHVVSPELLREVAAASVTLVEVVRLRLEVSAALREVEASRARLVQVGYEERRRLERDLHDGAQQRLVSLGMALRLAQRHLGEDATDVDGMIDETVAELGTAVAELRQIAHGLRPTSLDDGLHAALMAMTQHVPIPVALDVDHPEPLPDDVATTVYYVTSEAVANAVKHAGATRIDVHISRTNGHLGVRVTDDGCGGAHLCAGSGLAGLSDRVQALGGALALDSRDGHGTTLEATVPCAS